MLVLYNVRMVPNVKKIRETPNVTKVQSHVIFFFFFFMGTCDVGIAQCGNNTIKCEKKIRKLPNVTKVQLHVMRYCTM